MRVRLDEAPKGAIGLIRVIGAGYPHRRGAALEQMAAARERVREGLARLPAPLRGLGPGEPYPVAVAPRPRALAEQVARRLEASR